MDKDTRKIRQALTDATAHWLEKARILLGRGFDMPEIRFDLRGQAAGQYRNHPQPCIRYNLSMAAGQLESFLARTPGHEVAHYVIDQLHGRRNIRPHGSEWRQLMADLGLDAARCHCYSLEKVPTRHQQRYLYRCACQNHELSATRHNRILRGKAEYRCRRCGETLVSAK
ncbi:SprT family zinc-dependent metalloprotease [Thiolapillus sp.]